MSKKNKVLTILFTIGCLSILVVALASSVVASGMIDNTDRICEGVSIGAIEVGGMTAEEAAATVEEYVDDILERQVFVQVSENRLETTTADLGLSCEWEKLIDKAYKLGKKGNFYQRFKTLEAIRLSGKGYKLPFKLSQETVRDYVKTECAKYDIKAKNSKLKLKDGKPTATEDQIGHEVQVDATVEAIVEKLIPGGTVFKDSGSIEVEAVVEDTEPKYTQEMLSKCENLLGSYSTSYASSAEARANNVKTAADYINGTVLYPDKIFSTIKVIKDRTEENGYQAAPEYSSGNVVEGIGGGVCQVSTTLYNAVINAELEVVERSPHSMVVSYVDVSRDAAISGDYKDFKFKNNTEAPVYIMGIAEGRTLTFRIYGEESREENREISFEPEILETIQPGAPETTVDPSKPASYREVTQTAHVGYRAKLWKIVKINGEETERVEINNSSYSAEPEHIVVGASHSTSKPKASAGPSKKPTSKPKKTEKPEDERGGQSGSDTSQNQPKATPVQPPKPTAAPAAPAVPVTEAPKDTGADSDAAN